MGDVWMNRQGGVKMFLIAITAPIYIKTSPVNFAGMGGNGNKEFCREKTCSNCKSTLDRHSPRLFIDDSLLPDQPLFSLLSTFRRLTHPPLKGLFTLIRRENGRFF
jgi:hypothetical protein